MIDVLIPTYGRPGRLAAVAANVHDATTYAHRVVFIVEPDDSASIGAARATGETVVVNERTPNYAGAMNTAVADVRSGWWFAGADDVRFDSGWDLAALAVGGAVIGTNDLHNPFVLDGVHATHYLVDAGYVAREGGTLTEGPGVAYFEGYTHQYTDTEFIGVAKARCKFRPCLDSIVEHMHYTFGLSAHDATYDRAYVNLDADRDLYLERKQAWASLSL